MKTDKFIEPRQEYFCQCSWIQCWIKFDIIFTSSIYLSGRTLHALGLNHGQFGIQELNLPRGDSISRTVQFSKTEPPMLMPHIMDG